MKFFSCILTTIFIIAIESKPLESIYIKLKSGFTCSKNFPGSSELTWSQKLVTLEFGLLETVCTVKTYRNLNKNLVILPYSSTDGISAFLTKDMKLIDFRHILMVGEVKFNTNFNTKYCPRPSTKLMFEPHPGFNCGDWPDSEEIKWMKKPFFSLSAIRCIMNVCLNTDGTYDGPVDKFTVIGVISSTN